jgi:hypothetical protein
LFRLRALPLPAAAVLIATSCILAQNHQPPPQSPQPPAQLTAEQDHQRLLDLLHITSLRPGVDHNPNAANPVNYDEAKANPYTKLPDPLLLNNGRRVVTKTTWFKQRRPELLELFSREIYGRVPANVPKVNWRVMSTTRESDGDIPVITKKLVGHVDNSSYPLITVDVDLSLTTPANAKGPVPVIMEFTWEGYPDLKQYRQAPSETTWKHQVLSKGWGYATLRPTSIQADNGAGLTLGIIGLVNKGQPRKLDDWGAIRAWAWGGSRALDYFETDKAVDAKQVGLSGHSRFGKTALVAMAYDLRFAIAYISSSGTGGAQLFRRNFGERLENVAGPREYHWMAGNFLKYAGPLHVNDLPVDAHELIALSAPRPVFIGAGTTKADGWADARGMFDAAVAASPVYTLLGRRGLSSTTFPPIETPLLDGDIAFRQHSGGHTPAPNFPFFVTFASRYIKVNK